MKQDVDLRATIDQGGIGAVQRRVFLLCGLCLVLDGFDVQAIGYLAPAIAEDWGTRPAALGVVFSAGLIGMVIGSSILSSIADRLGRRPVLIGATLLAGVAMSATSLVADVNQLLLMRFITGLGLGALMPNTLALTAEYTPTRIRTTMVMVMACGFTFGAALGGWIVSAVIQTLGWRGVFVLGGLPPFALGLLMIATLPESLRLLVVRGAGVQRINRQLKDIYPAYKEGTEYRVLLTEPIAANSSPAQLFREGRALTSLIFWVIGFMGLLDLYLLSNWLPTVIRGAHYPLRTAVLASTMLQVGGVLGTLVMARFARRFSLRNILILSFLIAACAIFSIGLDVNTLPILLVSVFVAGFCVIGGVPGLNALAADYYPTFIRSTGLGWMLAIGRLGSIIGPLVGGFILQAGMGAAALFIFAAVPALITCIAIWSLSWFPVASKQ
jgi:AAHS family 4-hydroxybenzoate transporter-like MFS transporter